VVGIDLPAGIEERIESALRGWAGGDGALRITLTRGSGPGILPSPTTEGRFLLFLRSFESVPTALTEGLRAIVRGRLDERSLTSGLKFLGYLERIQAARLAHEAGAEEALLQNSTGLLVEGTASNLFGVLDGVLIAPGVREGALPGITREVLLEEAYRLGMPVEERGIAVEELNEISELFLSSSLRELVAVTEVEGGKIGIGALGPVFHELAGRYASVVDKELNR
jgi:branched-subunit amino acid aminotransferase/4-amino-4-deoxychorismate lyase